jgi:gluconolactonase
MANEPVTCEKIPTDRAMANGGVNYRDGVIFCAQGTLEQPSGLVYMDATAPYRSKPLLDSFYGRQFNSLNDVVVHADGSIWFTDPIYGFEQGFRPPPQLPNQVYRYDPTVESVRAMADGFGRPNGISFSPDQSTIYITDTDYIHGDGSKDPTRASAM